MPIRIFIYEDNAARRDSLRVLTEMTPELEYVGEAPDCRNVIEEMGSAQPDLILMDINMPHVNGIAGLKSIREKFPHIKVLIQTVFEDNDTIFECIRNGADGYILKKDSPMRIIEAIQELQNGGSAMNPGIARKVLEYFQPKNSDHDLSKREIEVLELLAEGLSYKMVADKLDLSFNTVNSHVKRIYEKLHISSIGEAIAYYYKNIHR